jgi:hypothetical protein
MLLRENMIELKLSERGILRHPSVFATIRSTLACKAIERLIDRREQERRYQLS